MRPTLSRLKRQFIRGLSHRPEPTLPTPSVARPTGVGTDAPGTQTRTDLLLSMIDTNGLGLEIGAGYNPLLPKSKGFRVETIDHATQEELRRKYAGSGMDIDRIEPVDHVCAGGSLADAVGRDSHYDFIVASHVIEHMPDLLGFLLDCQRLLKPSGTLALAVPDKRYSFDALRPVCTTGDVLQAHLEGLTRHRPGRVFDEIAYNSLRSGLPVWDASHRGDLDFVRPLQDAWALYNHARLTNDFIDIHAWQFTPASFRLMINDLHQIGALQLREAAFHGDQGSEFMIGLSGQGSGCAVPRVVLARQAIAEHHRIFVGDSAA